MISTKLLIRAALVCAPALLTAQGLDPSQINKPLKDDWPTYNGDYSGKRYSALTQLNQSNVSHLTLAWVSRVTAGSGGGGGFGAGGTGATGAGAAFVPVVSIEAMKPA